MQSKWYAIVNPLAGSGRGRADWPQIQALLAQRGIAFDFALTQWKYHAIELAVGAVGQGYRQLIAVGGDGTLNEVVNGVFIQQAVPPSQVAIAVIGVGTGNDWQRMYGATNSYPRSVEAIGLAHTVLQDVGRVEYMEAGVKHSRYFANAAGVGFDAEVARSTNRLKEKGRRGKALYMLSLLKTLIGYRTNEIQIAIDRQHLGGKIFSLTLGIGRYNGGGMMQVPNALPNDGLFDITIIRNVRRLEVVRNIYRLYNGTILNHPKIFGYQGRTVTISSQAETHLEVDGESLGTAPFTFSIVKQAIRVVVGADFESIQNPAQSLCTEAVSS